MFFFISGYFNKIGRDTKLTAYIARKFRSLMLGLFFLLGLASVYISKHFSYNEYPLLCPLPKCFFALPFIELGIIYRDHLETRLASLSSWGNIILILALMVINLFRMMILSGPDGITFLDLEYMTGFTSPYLMSMLYTSLLVIIRSSIIFPKTLCGS